MSSSHIRWLLPAMVALATAAAAAQGTPSSPSAPPAADPLDATAKVAPLVHQSALASYNRLGESAPLPWREANDRVGRIGGWRAYAREANAPDTPDTPTRTPPAAAAASVPMPAPVPKPMPGGHSGHKMH